MFPPFERKEQRMNNDKFVLTHGIWKGTDKNASSSSVTYHDSYNDAVKKFIEDEAFYARFGYVTWYADITYPDGSIATLK